MYTYYLFSSIISYFSNFNLLETTNSHPHGHPSLCKKGFTYIFVSRIHMYSIYMFSNRVRPTRIARWFGAPINSINPIFHYIKEKYNQHDLYREFLYLIKLLQVISKVKWTIYCVISYYLPQRRLRDSDSKW